MRRFIADGVLFGPIRCEVPLNYGALDVIFFPFANIEILPPLMVVSFKKRPYMCSAWGIERGGGNSSRRIGGQADRRAMPRSTGPAPGEAAQTFASTVSMYVLVYVWGDEEEKVVGWCWRD